MDPLAKLFGSAARLKLLRLFLFNTGKAYDAKEAAHRVRSQEKTVTKEVAALRRIGVIKKKPSQQEGTAKRGRVQYMADVHFPYHEALRQFLLDTAPLANSEVQQRLRQIGKVKFAAAAGVFLGRDDSAVDLLLVIDNPDQHKLDSAIHSLEVEMGKELTYAVFDSKDFDYRQRMNDRLVRDVLEFPHERIINKLNVV
jgi:predicted transcriptional regulator